MTWPQVDALAAAGHEIGGHTLTHVSLTDTTVLGGGEAPAGLRGPPEPDRARLRPGELRLPGRLGRRAGRVDRARLRLPDRTPGRRDRVAGLVPELRLAARRVAAARGSLPGPDAGVRQRRDHAGRDAERRDAGRARGRLGAARVPRRVRDGLRRGLGAAEHARRRSWTGSRARSVAGHGRAHDARSARPRRAAARRARHLDRLKPPGGRRSSRALRSRSRRTAAGASFECSLDGGGLLVLHEPGQATRTSATGSTPSAPVRATAPGNVDATPASWTWTINQPPAPTTVSLTFDDAPGDAVQRQADPEGPRHARDLLREQRLGLHERLRRRLRHDLAAASATWPRTATRSAATRSTTSISRAQPCRRRRSAGRSARTARTWSARGFDAVSFAYPYATPQRGSARDRRGLRLLVGAQARATRPPAERRSRRSTRSRSGRPTTPRTRSRSPRCRTRSRRPRTWAAAGCS